MHSILGIGLGDSVYTAGIATLNDVHNLSISILRSCAPFLGYPINDQIAPSPNLGFLAGSVSGSEAFRGEKRFPSSSLTVADGTVNNPADRQQREQISGIAERLTVLLREVLELASSEREYPISGIALSVPSRYINAQCRAILDTSSQVGLCPVGLINDTTAVVLNYGVNHPDLPDAINPFNVVFVIIGHSDCSVVVVGYSKGQALIESVACDPHAGGRDIDHTLALHFAKEIQDIYNVDVLAEETSYQALLAECQAVEVVLSTTSTATFHIHAVVESLSGTLELTKELLGGITSTITNRIAQLLHRTLGEAGLMRKDIEAVELVGGTIVIPSIQECIQSFFHGKSVSAILSHDYAVCKGAAYACSMLPLSSPRGRFVLQDSGVYPFTVQWSGALGSLNWRAEPEWDDITDPGLAILLEKITSTSVSQVDAQLKEVRRALVDLKSGDILDCTVENIAKLEQQEIGLLRQLTKLLPQNTSRSAAALFSFGHSLYSQFEKNGNLGDLNEAIDVISEAVALPQDINPVEADCFLTRLSDHFSFLADVFATRFQKLDEPADADKSILNQEIALCMTPKGHLDMPRRFSKLGNSFLRRFEREAGISGVNKGNLEHTIHLLMYAKPTRPAPYSKIENFLAAPSKFLGSTADINSAILNHRAAVDLTPKDHPEFSERLSFLGISLNSRFQRLQNMADINEAILIQERVLHILPEGHPSKPRHYSSLGESFKLRFHRRRRIADVENAILNHQTAVKLTPQDHKDRPHYLTNLGNSFLERFEHSRDIDDLNSAILNHKTAGDSNIASYFGNLGHSLMVRFKEFGDVADLNQAILNYETAITPFDHSTLPLHVCELGNLLLRRFERQRDIEDLNKAIMNLEAAVSFVADGHPIKLVCLTDLGNSLAKSFRQLGDIGDIDKAILIHKAVVHAGEGVPGYFNNLGGSCLLRFSRSGDVADLEEAISNYESAVRTFSDRHRHPSKPVCLTNLGRSLLERFKRLGEVADIDKAILQHQAAVRFTTWGDPEMSDRLRSLGISLLSRHTQFGDIADLNKAILNLSNALEITPDGDPRQPTLFTILGNSVMTRFHLLQSEADLNDAILKFQAAVRIMPATHPDKLASFGALASALSVRSAWLGINEHTDEAISDHDAEIRLSPADHPGLLMPLQHLGTSLMRRYLQSEAISDLNKAIENYESSARMLPAGHAMESKCLNNLGISLLCRFIRLGDIADCQRAVLAFSKSANSLGPPSDRFQGALYWSRSVFMCDPSKTQPVLDAYTCVLRLLPRISWLGVSTDTRYHQLLQANTATTVACDAAATAILYNDNEKAVEWLEQGRSIVWGQSLHLRTPLDDLRAVNPDIAAELQRVSAELETDDWRSVRTDQQTKYTHYQAILAGLTSESHTIEEFTQKRHQLALEWDRLLSQAQKVTGFEDFLKPKLYSQLRLASSAGPVVVVNISRLVCDVLILLTPTEPLRHVPLPHFSYDKAHDMKATLDSVLSNLGLRKRGDDDRAPNSKWPDADESFKSILGDLWTGVVKPVLDSLAFQPKTTRNLPRIWWCLTGPLAFLPVHAAGLYSEDAASTICLADFAISSYTPTLSALIAASSRETSGEPLKLLAVIQESTPLEPDSPLPGAVKELEKIRDRVSKHPILTLEGTQATVAAVLSAMEECSWVHFACHGVQDNAHPTKSGLILQDARLELSDVIKKRLPKADFAFLSACQTATGYDQAPDEAVHLAAGMLFAGYRSVVASMWSIADVAAPRVADRVYSDIVRDGQPNSLKAALALHNATQRLRKQSQGRLFALWVPFIHVGA